MTALKTAGTVAVGMLATLSVASFGQSGAARDAAPRPATATIVLDSEAQLGILDWIEKSHVAALTEGVIEKMELREGDPAVKDQPIGYLHKEIAELTVAKNALLSSNTASIVARSWDGASPRAALNGLSASCAAPARPHRRRSCSG